MLTGGAGSKAFEEKVLLVALYHVYLDTGMHAGTNMSWTYASKRSAGIIRGNKNIVKSSCL